MTLAKLIYRHDDRRDNPFAEGIAQAKMLIPGAGRFVVDQSVMDAVQRMENTPFADLLQALEHARLPFPVTWIEWSHPGGGNLGYLVEHTEGGLGFAFRHFLQSGPIERVLGCPVFCNLGRILVDPNGFRCEHPADAAASDDNSGQHPQELATADLISMLLIINSPSRVVTIDEAPDTERVDRRRAREGRPPLPNLRPIRLDVTRLRQVDIEHGVALADGRVRAEHFVRGHFKFRGGQMRWWSPHIRNQVGADAAGLPRDYQVVHPDLN